MQNAFIRLVAVQFAVYAIVALLGFAAWIIAFSNSLLTLELLVGEYLSGHLLRWTTKLPLWGVPVLAAAISSFGTVLFLRKSRREGGYLGIVAFLLGFSSNLLFAQNVLLHFLVGSLIG